MECYLEAVVEGRHRRYAPGMKSTPARLADAPAALVVMDEAQGGELLLTETGRETLTRSLDHESQATAIAAGSFLGGAALTAIGAAASGGGLLGAAAVAPVALLGGYLWGRRSFRKKLRRLGRGQIPRRAVLGGGRGELLVAAAAFLILGALPLGGGWALPLFLMTAASAVATYGAGGRRLREQAAQALPEFSEALDLLEDPQAFQLLGQASSESGNCPVCGDGLGGPGTHVLCERCGTGHHPECWSYAGRCSVFGCGGEHVSTAHLDAAL